MDLNIFDVIALFLFLSVLGVIVDDWKERKREQKKYFWELMVWYNARERRGR